MKHIFIFLLIAFIFIGCGEDCYNAPQTIAFKFVNSNDENLITNGTLTAYSVKDENQVGVQSGQTHHKLINFSRYLLSHPAFRRFPLTPTLSVFSFFKRLRAI
ncbi:hypothetical protein HHL23_16535, partial [Chryseobacterium sp. RP-3-3]